MTRKRITFRCASTLKTPIKTLEQQPLKFTPAICPINVEEQKERFLKHGKLPKFILKGSEDEIEQLYNKESNQIRFDLYSEAEHILYTVKEKFGDGENFLTATYGEKISKDEANEILATYLKENNLDGAMNIIWCADLASSARMMWIGPHAKLNRPEARNFSFWIKNTLDNQFIRSSGIRCLADHEIGTHFFRAFNDGLQPWYSDRRRWGIRGLHSLEQLRTEEGLAAINTILNAKARYLWGPAMLYYTACKAAEMSFKQLFDHLAQFIDNPESRWRHCTRVKRGLLDPNDLGGYGKDQCYFEGAVEILRNIDNLDFNILMSGKICVDEVSRCKRLARTDCIRLPAFMRIEKKYKKALKQIAHINGVNLPHPKVSPPLAYIQRLKRGRRIGPESRQQVRKRIKKKNRKCKKGSTSSSSESTGESEYEEINNIINRNARSCMPWSYVSDSYTVNFIQNDSSNYIENIVSTLDQKVSNSCTPVKSSPTHNSVRNSLLNQESRENSSCDIANNSSEVHSITNISKIPSVSPVENSKMSLLERGSQSDGKMQSLDRESQLDGTESQNSKSLNEKTTDAISLLEKDSLGDGTRSENSNAISEKVDSPPDESQNNNARESSIISSKSFDSENFDTFTLRNSSRTSSSISADRSTIVLGDENQSRSSSVQDESHEVTLDRFHFGTSYSSCNSVLNDLPLMDYSNSTNQSPVFRHLQSEKNSRFSPVSKSSSVQSFTELGPERFIYPDFEAEQFLKSDCNYYPSTCTTARLPVIIPSDRSPRLLGRRTQSAANRITSESLPCLPQPYNIEMSTKRKH